MRLRFSPAAALLAALAAGCSNSRPLPMAARPEAARPALESALAAWRDGKTPADLQTASPPVYVNDPDFARGRKLVDFRVTTDGKPFGTGLRYDVTLTVQDGIRSPTVRKVAYRVATDPTTSIFREDN
jgi:hypothetical protein